MSDAPAPSVPPTYVDLNRWWVDSGVRALALRWVEGPTLRRLGGGLDGGHLLELGCGRRGTGLVVALDVLGAGRVTGVDVHPASVVAVGRATAGRGAAVAVRQADASALPLDDESVDGVLASHVLHHAEDWRAVVAEGARVLRPGGRWFGAEMTRAFVDSRALRAVSFHPPADRPSSEDLVGELARHGLVVGDRLVERLGAWVRYAAVKEG